MNPASSSRAILGPLAECDIFPLYGQQVVLQNLILSRLGHLVALDELLQTNTGALSEPIQWRAVVHLTVNERHNGVTNLPHLTTHGSALVTALAKSRNQVLQSPAAIVIQGSTVKMEWTSPGPLSLILYSDRPNGRREFIVESLHIDSPDRSFLVLRSHHLIHWMNKAKVAQRNQSRDAAWYVKRYVEEYPSLASDDRTRGSELRTHPSHIRNALVSLLVLRDTREKLKKDALLTNEALLELLYEYTELQEVGLASREDGTMPAEVRLPDSSPRRGSLPSNEKSVASNSMDEVLRTLPRAYFDTPDLPTDLEKGDKWRCPEDECQISFPTVDSLNLRHDEEQALMQFRRDVATHLWTHLEARGLAESLHGMQYN